MSKVKMLIFDPKKVKLAVNHAKYDVTYKLYYSNNDTSELSITNWDKLIGEIRSSGQTNVACFSQFMSLYNKFKSVNGRRANRARFMCKLDNHPNSKLHLSRDELRCWVDLCKANKLMPDNIGDNFIENCIYDINFEDISLNMLYIYLCSARYVQEEPFFIRSVLHMVGDLEIGFFTSIGVSTKFCITNTGHHILGYNKDYSVMAKAPELNNETVATFNEFNLTHVAKLANFVNGGDKGKPLKKAQCRGGGFDLHLILNNLTLRSSPFCMTAVARKDLRHKHLEEFIVTGKLNKSLVI